MNPARLWCSSMIACVASMVALQGEARAQSDEVQRRTVAEALFQQAVQLREQHDYAKACPKFEEVVKLQPGKVGAMLELARCFEAAGRVASAKTAYELAERAAAAAGDGRAAEAHEGAAALAARVPTLTIMVAPAIRELPGLEVKRDGIVMGVAQWGEALPVDPGKHTMVATAPGKKPWTADVEVAEKGRVSLAVPDLAAEVVAAPIPGPPPAIEPSPSPSPPPASPTSTRRAVGIGLSALGVAALGTAGVLAGLTRNRVDGAAAYCTTGYSSCFPYGVTLLEQARTMQTAAIVLAAGGTVSAGTGIALVVTSPSAKGGGPPVPRVTAALGPLGMSVRGVW
jgi:hypothetical protein